ncbi:hypothetical protein XENORESO_014550 [Xenotaenia resolanae]|uniref:Uncharacterized protein n=1 Tax=Xenotaenia resolanae TaxID=208358 RepID=A0ABV0WT64_9TELE
MGRTHNLKALICLLFFMLPKLETGSGKVLEETYLKWVQYKQDCVRMIKNELLPQVSQGSVRRQCGTNGLWETDESGHTWRDISECEEEKEVASQEVQLRSLLQPAELLDVC